MHENRDDDEPGLEALLAHMTPVDLVLVEGFKSEGHDKIEVHRRGLEKPLLCRADRSFIALAANYQPDDLKIPRLDLDDVEAVADFVTGYCNARDLAS
jgi:molybdopterin-guanine dinucleotide biosynthesis protein B